MRRIIAALVGFMMLFGFAEASEKNEVIDYDGYSISLALPSDCIVATPANPEKPEKVYSAYQPSDSSIRVLTSKTTNTDAIYYDILTTAGACLATVSILMLIKTIKEKRKKNKEQ